MSLSAQEGKSPAPLSLEDVVQLYKAGLPEEVIITKIRKSAKAFDLSAGELLELKKIGISGEILKYLLDPSIPYAAPLAPAAAPPTDPRPAAAPLRKFPPDAFASKVPPEPGLYRFEEELPVKIDVKILLGVKQAASMKGLMKKEKVTAYLVGPASKTRIMEPTPAFYLRLAEGKAIEEIVLAALTPKSGRRELETGPPAPKQELKAESMKQFDAVEVAPQLFRIAPSSLPAGEYLFFQIGSAEPPKGSYGKGFDFGIGPAGGPKKKKQKK